MPMSEAFHVQPAAEFDLTALADLYTRAFADYVYPVIVTSAELARRIPVERIDLDRSRIAYVDQTPAGLALLCLEGDHACCGGFGITTPFRGRGIATPLTIAMLEAAREAGARHLRLIVLVENEPAVRTYLRAGLRIRRTLETWTWRRPPACPPVLSMLPVRAAPPAALLAHFAALHTIPPIWSRDLPTLQRTPDLSGWAVFTVNERLTAYALVNHCIDGSAELVDIAAEDTDGAWAVIHVLQATYDRITLSNEPVESPLAALFAAAGFVTAYPRYEMDIAL
jgi:RimJ/RimL family protein N-acetyltransferase